MSILNSKFMVNTLPEFYLQILNYDIMGYLIFVLQAGDFNLLIKNCYVNQLYGLPDPVADVVWTLLAE